MEQHIIDVIRFGFCISSLAIAVAAMVKADDNNAMRRLTAALEAVIIFFNEQIGQTVYLLIGSTIEVLIAMMGLGFVLIAGIVIMLLPALAALRWMAR